MKLALSLLVLALPAGAQQFGAPSAEWCGTFRQAAGAVAAQVQLGQNHKQRLAALESAMTNMNDGPQMGGEVVSWVRDHKTEIRFEDQKQVSRTDNKGAVVLDWQIPAYPRPIAARVAWEVAAMMVADMPASSEKEYMRRSITARAWLELGGDASRLPFLEPVSGEKDEALSQEMKLWLDNKAEMALYKIGEATKTKSVMELMDEEKDPAKREALNAANKRFVDFLIAEPQRRSNSR
jgi:hypothetical protein